jgi:hypothetical protein
MFAGHCNAQYEGKAFSKDMVGRTYADSPGARDRRANLKFLARGIGFDNFGRISDHNGPPPNISGKEKDDMEKF